MSAEPNGGAPLGRGSRAAIAGGGIAGVAAAAALAERGVKVTILEPNGYLGGRAGAWTDTLADGTTFEMERGFHAFFRQYYNLHRLLRRADPDLAFLRPLDDYPILGPEGLTQSFSGLPRRTPWNLLVLTRRSPALRLRDLRHVDAKRALEMLTFDPARTYAQLDTTTAKDYLDSLGFPADARRLLFDVFAHSFFNPESEYSAAELLMMFHFYFTGNPEGLVFDVSSKPFSRSIWDPMKRYLERLGVDVRLGESAEAVARGDDGWRVRTGGDSIDADGVVLAVTVPALQRIASASPDLAHDGWRASVDRLSLTRPFAVWRLWLDAPTHPDRAPFAGTTGLGVIDNISLYHQFEDESREWAERTGGSVVELHAYAVPDGYDEARLRDELLGALHALYPETRDAGVVEDRFILAQDCPAFAPGSRRYRPGVDTPFAGVALAGDFVSLDMPSALMERAAASGFMAANRLLSGAADAPETILSVPERGMLARFAG